jgi:DNA processing protein
MREPGLAVDETEWLHHENHHLVGLGDDAYPELLAGIAGPPPQIYINGDPEILHLPALAIVGSRNPTTGGARNAFEFARHLGETGFCIVSGLAQGIDAAAHRGALAAGAPTVAFLGHGIDRIYPAANSELAREIAARGALVSEFPLGTAPGRALFPQRNRLISGLSLGTLVVEAARRSGSLITARLAAEQGREVFAIPGSIHNPLSRGCHQLIPMHETGLSGRTQTGPDEADTEYVKLLEGLGHDPVTTDELVERSGLTIDQVSSMLLILELEGKIEKLSGGRYSVLS